METPEQGVHALQQIRVTQASQTGCGQRRYPDLQGVEKRDAAAYSLHGPEQAKGIDGQGNIVSRKTIFRELNYLLF